MLNPRLLLSQVGRTLARQQQAQAPAPVPAPSPAPSATVAAAPKDQGQGIRFGRGEESPGRMDLLSAMEPTMPVSGESGTAHSGAASNAEAKSRSEAGSPGELSCNEKQELANAFAQSTMESQHRAWFGELLVCGGDDFQHPPKGYSERTRLEQLQDALEVKLSEAAGVRGRLLKKYRIAVLQLNACRDERKTTLQEAHSTLQKQMHGSITQLLQNLQERLKAVDSIRIALTGIPCLLRDLTILKSRHQIMVTINDHLQGALDALTAVSDDGDSDDGSAGSPEAAQQLLEANLVGMAPPWASLEPPQHHYHYPTQYGQKRHARWRGQAPTQGSALKLQHIQADEDGEFVDEDAVLSQASSSKSGTRRRAGSNRGRLPTPATEAMKSWFSAHWECPNPSDDQKLKFVRKFGISKKQVENWFINQRMRLWRPAMARGETTAPLSLTDHERRSKHHHRASRPAAPGQEKGQDNGQDKGSGRKVSRRKHQADVNGSGYVEDGNRPSDEAESKGEEEEEEDETANNTDGGEMEVPRGSGKKRKISERVEREEGSSRQRQRL
ncbi:unnamed protein product [Chrysoparadoxa australica]